MPWGRMEGRRVECAPAVAVEAGVLSRAALEGADGTLAGGMLLEALDGMPAVPLHGMEGARPRAVHPMTSEAVTALCLKDALDRQPVSVDRPVRADNARNRRRCMPGDDALCGQRKRYPGEHECHHPLGRASCRESISQYV